MDDSLTVRELVRKLLANRGYLADVAVDGMDGLEKATAEQFDLIINDINMQGMDGFEIIRRDGRRVSVELTTTSVTQNGRVVAVQGIEPRTLRI